MRGDSKKRAAAKRARAWDAALPAAAGLWAGEVGLLPGAPAGCSPPPGPRPGPAGGGTSMDFLFAEGPGWDLFFAGQDEGAHFALFF